MERMTLTWEDIPRLAEVINQGYRAGSAIVVYKGVAMDHRPAHHVFEALQAGEEEVTVGYESWQSLGGGDGDDE